MAVVVTARSQVEPASSGLAHQVCPSTRARPALQALIVGGVVCYAMSLVLEAAFQAAPDTDWLETVATIGDGLAAVSVAATCVAAWLALRDDTGLLLLATLAPVLTALRAVATPLLSTLDFTVLAAVASTALGLLVLGCLAWLATAAPFARSAALPRTLQTERFGWVSVVTAFAIFGVCLSGAIVRAVGASWACAGAFPDCNGQGVLPFGHDPVADIQLYHRMLSYVALGLVLWLAVEALRIRSQARFAACGLLVGTLLVAAIGALSVSIGTPPLAEVAHMAATTATWSAAIAVIVLARAPVGATVAAEPPSAARIAVVRGRSPALTVISAYVQLTKPRVMSLLLATTAAAMVIAARGLPELGLFVATLVGGALMSGGAGAINHYVDRDIDPLMGRTAWRPIPSGVIAPRDALRFGIALAVIASAVFLAFVNVLACVFALLGLLGYVFIYTLWLKRSTPSNIVIGGAAGAIPPLVGWAAVTNEVGSLTAWYLFAIIFFWTPPHFWALSLLIRRHYERAGVPMLPVVRGEDETRRQIVLYSALLVMLTLVLSPFGLMGWMYFAAAAALGALFIVDAVRLWREGTPQAARRLYLYSILYLFALFAAMAVDRVVW
jgi:protoheme IX farnesyltransferase